MLFSLRGERQVSQKVVIVGIDEKSIRELGPWPFSREKHALLFERLKKARAVGFDIIFAEESREMALLAGKGVPMVMAAATSYEGEMLAPNVVNNSWITVGHIEAEICADGIIREVNLKKNDVFSFAYALFQERANNNIERNGVLGKRLINFYGPAFTFPYISYIDVLKGEYPLDFFKDCYVLIGAMAVGLGDAHLTSFSNGRRVPGVEIQATILNNLLDSSFLYRFSFLEQFVFSCFLLTVLLLFYPRYNLCRNFLLVSVALIVLAGLSWLLFFQNIFFDPLLPLVMVVLGHVFHATGTCMVVTKKIVQEITELNRKQEEGILSFFSTVQCPLELSVAEGSENKRKKYLGSVDRYMEHLSKCIYALSLQNNFVQHLVSAETPPFVFWAKDSGRVIVANARFSALWERLKVCTGPPDLYTFFHLIEENRVGKDREREYSAVLSDGKIDLQEELVCDILLRGHGQQRIYLHIVAHEVDDQAFGFEGILVSLTDVTEIHELERLKGDVMNIVSHELRLPLTTIIGYSELLSDSLDGREREYALNIFGQAQRLVGMITDFLDITRIENGRNMINHLPFDFITVINDALAVASVTASSKGISLESDLPTRVSLFWGDELLMTQLVINLLDNAIKFSPEQTTVWVKLEELETEFHLLVVDEGSGITDAEKTEIFKKFSRGKSGRQGVGFGLGLSLVSQVVESHGGAIWITDAVDGGAVFHISLPLNKK